MFRKGLGFRVYVLGFRLQGFGFRVHGFVCASEKWGFGFGFGLRGVQGV